MENEYIVVAKIKDGQILRVVCHKVLAVSVTSAISVFLSHQKTAISWEIYRPESTILKADG